MMRAAIGTALLVWVLSMTALTVLLMAITGSSAAAQVHQHPTETITGATAHFYETWQRPDMPDMSCCDKKDCYATPARMEGGKVLALHRESGDWIEVPEAKIELNRTSPDSRNHLCASEYKFIYCFIWGAGT
jgi:hypothetical protein